MKVLVIERFHATDDQAPEQIIGPKLLQLWAYWAASILREAYKLPDKAGAIYVLEVAGLEEARSFMMELPTVISLSKYEFYTITPYNGWERLFRTKNSSIRERLEDMPSISRPLTKNPKPIWVMLRLSINFTQELYQQQAEEQSLVAWQLYKAGIVQEYFVIPTPFAVWVKIVAGGPAEVLEYVKLFPFHQCGIIDSEVFVLQPFDFWQGLMPHSCSPPNNSIQTVNGNNVHSEAVANSADCKDDDDDEDADGIVI